MRLIILSVTLIIATAGVAHGQSANGFERSGYNTASYYRHVEPGEVAVYANVWGNVRNPGLYEVPRGTRVGVLLSLAGGPSAREWTRRERRSIVVRLSRLTDSGERDVVLEQTMDDALTSLPDDILVQDGDVLTVDTIVRQKFTWRDAFPIIAAVASTTIAIDRVIVWTRR